MDRFEQQQDEEDEQVVTRRSKLAKSEMVEKEKKKKPNVNIVISAILISVSVVGILMVNGNIVYDIDSGKIGIQTRGNSRVDVTTVVNTIENPAEPAASPDPSANPNPNTAPTASPSPPGVGSTVTVGSGAGTGEGKAVEVIDNWLAIYDNTTVAGNYYSIDPSPLDGYIAGKWSMGEGNGYKGNPWAIRTYTDQARNRPNGASEGLVDGQNRYWVAVGPKVTKQDFNVNAGGDVGYGKLFDLVVEDNNTHTVYYIPCKSGDAKVHTFPTGIIQTGRHIPDGALTPGTDDHSIVEWVGVTPSVAAALGQRFTLKQILVYE